ncbi:hypothetical protein B296_00035867 [Ensete ventricosum]|uniref:Uncharacterized protein n=1 Tax=Ensete ventricosum TaxID=4639 RepID=A0A426XHH1_ENSVE|nr:hypothetical protein B296_00035867 [Ensete ventricosum]
MVFVGKDMSSTPSRCCSGSMESSSLEKYESCHSTCKSNGVGYDLPEPRAQPVKISSVEEGISTNRVEVATDLRKQRPKEVATDLRSKQSSSRTEEPLCLSPGCLVLGPNPRPEEAAAPRRGHRRREDATAACEETLPDLCCGSIGGKRKSDRQRSEDVGRSVTEPTIGASKVVSLAASPSVLQRRQQRGEEAADARLGYNFSNLIFFPSIIRQ